MHHCQSKKTSNRATFPSFTTPVCICGNATMQTACLKFICHITTWFSTREPIAKVCSLYLTGHSVEQRQGRYPVLVVLHVVFKLQPEVHAGAVDEWPWTPVLSLFVASLSNRSVPLDRKPHRLAPCSCRCGVHIPPTRIVPVLVFSHTTIDLPDSRVGPHALLVRAAMRLHAMLMYADAGSQARSVRPERDGHAARCGEVSPTMGRLHVLVTTYEGQPIFFLCFRLTLTYRTKREKARPEEPLLPPRRCFRSSCALSPPSPYEHAAYPESAQDACSLPSCRAASCTRCRTADAQYGPLQLEAALVEGRSRPPSILPLMHSAPRCMLTRLQASSASAWCAARRSCSAASRRSQLIARHIAVHTGSQVGNCLQQLR
ncbi:hypothetical protein GGX14DRAFT_557778 [Mycena pura]|uniref:Uncharacterized protein n=1 Tax=Mycena pura TaxID=153505 RepID=A0AAD6YM17_9AGAR|nr:hypothetical protein GGX14DRAFT_557778 [Mycena pura]